MLSMRWISLIFVGSHIWGCAAASPPNLSVESYGFDENNLVWVRGPWAAIHPSDDPDDVIDQLCDAVGTLPLARDGDHGREYCGALYTRPDGKCYASQPSPLMPSGQWGPSTKKQCYPPRFVRDSSGVAKILADYHSHPWLGSRMSREDIMAANQSWSIRIQFDARCRVMKLVPYLDENRPGEVYERQSRVWKMIGIVKPEDKSRGYITPVSQ